MAGSCWRLLAFVSLSIVVVPVFLFSQDWAANRMSGVAGSPLFAERLANPEPIGVSPKNPTFPGTNGLLEITRAAGIIFSGHVTSVGRAPSAGRAYASTSITFQVEHPMRGTKAGESLTIHEWSGLWTRGEHYRVGERVLLFLYPPSRLGLTSPVAGIGGRFAVDPHGRVLINAQNRAALSADPLSTARTAIPYADFARAVLRTDGER
jgi:hypothetical protein